MYREQDLDALVDQWAPETPEIAGGDEEYALDGEPECDVHVLRSVSPFDRQIASQQNVGIVNLGLAGSSGPSHILTVVQ
jgi:hypothetical protein